MANQTVRVGWLARKSARADLLQLGFAFSEFKHPLYSEFVVYLIKTDDADTLGAWLAEHDAVRHS